jgi:putative pyruvate formate lyase activating enzyme
MEDSTRRDFMLAGFAAPATLQRNQWQAGYVQLGENEVARRAAELRAVYTECRLCPRQCGVNRAKGEKGVCGATATARVASYHPHFGEERPLVGRGGSGTIFFSNCNLLCEFCQNWQINHRGDGRNVNNQQLAGMMIDLQRQGCHNINLVTPTHLVPNIVDAVRIAMGHGLRVPLVYNCGGYDPVSVLRLLDGIIDIYLPDFKYTNGAAAAKLSRGVKDYPEVCAAAISEMHRQVGKLVVDENRIALRGLMIRHLVLPNNMAGTDRLVKWVADQLGKETFVNIMGQYRPMHRARQFREIDRRLTRGEFSQAAAWARQAGLTNLDGV